MRYLPWQSVPEFFHENPWAVDALEWLQFTKEWWHRYESIIVVVALWLVARKISRERERLEERVNTLSQHVKAAIDASDVAIVKAQEVSNQIVTAFAAFTPASGGRAMNGAQPAEVLQQSSAEGSANWERIRDIWANLKERIDLRIENIAHKKVREKYSHMDRRTYRSIISKLEEDGLLKAAVADTLRELARRYQALKFHPQDITPDQVERFVEGQQIVNASRDLPYITEQEVDALSSQTRTQTQQQTAEPGLVTQPTAA